ncbi:MAG TPA: thiamine-phosphate kinase [Rudaea sp.]|nr:thiamine-phosphate kinase [Rudaea sp.]
MSEFELIDIIRTHCAIARDDVRLGIGDDAAILTVPANHQLVVSTDTLVSGVHFPETTQAADIGWKSLAVNLSDLAAMGATPAWATLALTLPVPDRRWVEAFSDGFASLAREFKLALVGGDTTQGPLSITVTVHGFVPSDAALLRSGARVGDFLFVTGTLGDAAGGLRLMAEDGQRDDSMKELVQRLNRPTPRVAQGLVLRGRARSCIDVSDGLLADLGHICAASGVGCEVDVDALPTSSALNAGFGREERRSLQLGGGDDYELCFTASEEIAAELLGDLARSGCGATRVGRVVERSGVRVIDAAGDAVIVSSRGWEHFA